MTSLRKTINEWKFRRTIKRYCKAVTNPDYFDRNSGWSAGHWSKQYFPGSFKAWLWRKYWSKNYIPKWVIVSILRLMPNQYDFGI